MDSRERDAMASSSKPYLDQKEFQKICTANHIDANDYLLELYEEHGLLYPVFRLLRPKEHLQAIREWRFNNDGTIELDSKYHTLFFYESGGLTGFHWIIPEERSELQKSLEMGHPLEQAYKSGEKFIIKPTQETFIDWEKYIVTLPPTPKTWNFSETQSTAKHFYCPWQMYLLEELNRFHIRTFNILSEHRPTYPDYFRKWFGAMSRVAKWSKYFQVLWDFRFKQSILLVQANDGSNKRYIEGEAFRRLFERKKELAKVLYLSFEYKSWIEFLRILCEYYYKYIDAEKIRLSKNIKIDIGGAVDIVCYGSGKTYNELLEDVGMNAGGTIFFRLSPLERIYPLYERRLKHDAEWMLEVGIRTYNKLVDDDLRLAGNAASQIVEFALESGNDTLLSALIRLNKEIDEPTYYGNEGLWSHIRSLAVALESWVKTLTGKRQFQSALNSLTDGLFKQYKDGLRDNIGIDNLEVYSVDDLKTIMLASETLESANERPVASWMHKIVVAYLIRNYVAHHVKLDPWVFGSRLIEIWKSLNFLIFFAWRKTR